MGAGDSVREGRGGLDAETWRRRALAVWTMVGCCVVCALAVRVLGLVWPAVELVVVGVVIGFICSPITNALERHGVPRAAGALVALVVVVAVVVAFLALFLPPFLQQTVELLAHVPAYLEQVQDALGRFWAQFGSEDTEGLQSMVDQAVGVVSAHGMDLASNAMDQLTSGLVGRLTSSVGFLGTLFLGLVVGYWLAKDYPVMAHEMAVVSGPRHERSLTVMLAVLSRSMGGYMRSILFTSLICGALSFLGLAAVGHPYAGLMGIVIGIFHFVPVIGAWVSAAMATLLALFVSPLLAIETMAITVVAMNVTDNVISPLVMRSAVNVHPALSLLGIVLGNALGGVFGMVLAIPLTAAIRSVFVYYFEQRSGRQLVSYDGALFRSTPFRGEDGSVEPAFDALDDDKFFEDTLLVRPESAPQVEPAKRPAGVRMSLRDEISHRIRYGIAAAPGKNRAKGEAEGARSASIDRARGADPAGDTPPQKDATTPHPGGTSDRGDQ